MTCHRFWQATCRRQLPRSLLGNRTRQFVAPLAWCCPRGQSAKQKAATSRRTPSAGAFRMTFRTLIHHNLRFRTRQMGVVLSAAIVARTHNGVGGGCSVRGFPGRLPTSGRKGDKCRTPTERSTDFRTLTAAFGPWRRFGGRPAAGGSAAPCAGNFGQSCTRGRRGSDWAALGHKVGDQVARELPAEVSAEKQIYPRWPCSRRDPGGADHHPRHGSPARPGGRRVPAGGGAVAIRLKVANFASCGKVGPQRRPRPARNLFVGSAWLGTQIDLNGLANAFWRCAPPTGGPGAGR
jgi:hypothetical protein